MTIIIPNPPEPIKRSRPRDKLIPIETMKKLASLVELGVPVAVARRKLDIDILQSTCSALLKTYNTILKLDAMEKAESDRMADVMYKSLFPIWLDETVETPKNMSYYGHFPYGYWKEEESE